MSFGRKSKDADAKIKVTKLRLVTHASKLIIIFVYRQDRIFVLMAGSSKKF